jgi:Spy/CpxP family protein refolding chaperone
MQRKSYRIKAKRLFQRTSLILFFLAISLGIYAQPGRGQGRQMTEQDVRERVERLSDTLKLTESQEKEVLDFELDFYRTMQAERANFDPETSDREAMRERMREIRRERDAKYAEILTAEQLEKYNEMMEARRARMRERYEEESDRQRGRGRR